MFQRQNILYYFFDLKDCELFHISSNPNEDFIRIVGTEEMIEKSDEKTISKNSLEF